MNRGHRRQEQEAGSDRRRVMLRALGWEEGMSQQCEVREAGVESQLRHTTVLGRRVQAMQAR